MTRHLLLLAAISIGAAPPACGEDTTREAATREDATREDATREDAVEEIEALLAARPQGIAALRQRADDIGRWLERSASGADLGDHAYLRAVARYAQGRQTDAAAELLAYFEAHDRLPSHDHDTWVGQILIRVVQFGLQADDPTRAERGIELASRLSSPSSVYKGFGTVVRAATSDVRDRVLNHLLRTILADGALTDAEKQRYIEDMYVRVAVSRTGAPRELKPFRTTDTEGREIALEDYRGKVVLVDFWASWCAPCIREMPNVVEAWETYSERGFDIVGVSLDTTPSRMKATTERLGMKWRQICDGGGWKSRLAVDNGVRSIPATFLLDRQGRVRHVGLRGDELIAAIGELVAEPATDAEAEPDAKTAPAAGAKSDG